MSWRKLYEDGLEALRTRNWDAALERFEAAIVGDPQAWQPLYGRAWVRMQREADEGQLALAESDLRRALKLGGPYCADAAALLGSILLGRQSYVEATSLLLQAFGRSSAGKRVEEDLVTAFSQVLDDIEKGELDDASLTRTQSLEDLVRAAALPVPLANALLGECLATRVFCYQRLERPTEAAAASGQLAQLVPGHPRIPKEYATAATSASVAAKVGGEPSFAQVGGLDVPGSFQGRLRDLFETYLGSSDLEAARQRLTHYGQQPTRSILLFGPSGCGKTFIIRAFAGEYRQRFGRELSIQRLRLNEVLDRYVGESEKALTRIFNAAIETQPSILFADEIDAIGGSRDNSQDWKVSQTAHLLQEFDRLNSSGSFVIVFGCTNRVWAVELALLRRFDQLIPVEMPDQRVRESIFDVQLRRLAPAVRPLDPALAELARRAHGLTPGDIEKVVKRSVDLRLSASRQGGEVRLELGDLLATLREYRRPMHVRTWMRESVEALRRAGHDDMVAEVERLYRPYVDDSEPGAGGESAWRPLPEEAFRERQQHDLRLLRVLRR